MNKQSDKTESECPSCKDISNLKCVTCGRSISVSVDASELANHLAVAVDNLSDLPVSDDWAKEWTEKAERILGSIPSNESVSITEEARAEAEDAFKELLGDAQRERPPKKNRIDHREKWLGYFQVLERS